MPIASKERINIRPQVSILSVLSHLNYDPWYALAEFVDNSLQSFQDHKGELRDLEGGDYKLRVAIEINRTSETISIRDNAAGIHEKDYARAFRPAELPPDQSGLSEFGMGMKSAACWFSPLWKVRTSALGEPTEKTIAFDVEAIVENEESELEVETAAASEDQHFTEIVLADLHRLPQYRTLHKVKDHLRDIYRHFTREGLLQLTLNGESLEYDMPDILEAPFFREEDGGDAERWKKQINFDFGNGLKAEGFAAIRETGSTSKAGFSLFRRGRVIEGSGDQKYRPKQIFGNSNSFRYQRIFGELHLSGFGVSHTKDGFQWNENEQPFLELLGEELNSEPLPLLDQAEGFRKSSMKTDKFRKGAEEATESTTGSLENEQTSEALEESRNRGVEEDEQSELSTAEVAAQRIVEVNFQGVTWKVTVELTNDEAIGDWLEFSDSDLGAKRGDVKEIGIRLSLAHPFMKRYGGVRKEEIEPLLRVAVGLSLAELISRTSGVLQASSVRVKLNDLLRKCLHKPS